MLPNLKPVDELAGIRAQIRDLKAREAVLRSGFLTGHYATIGDGFEVQIKSYPRREFQRDMLPKHILDNPSYWKQHTARTVVLSERKWDHDEIELFEPFD